ncbi:glycosyltransferase family 4 protein [Haloplanus sp. C73]|uniref:glycosyltransferase family 4 protein n=1 Tax=Haloplanus sp. C73 TaxID=3421641 RepID=UPI003EBEA257
MARDSLSILVINDYCDVRGGAEEILHFQTELLESAGHDVTTVGFRRPGGDCEEVTDHVLTESSNRVRRIAEKVVLQPGIYRDLRHLLDSVSPDVVHVHKNVNYPTTVLLACRNYPVLKTHHDFTNVCPSGWAVYQDTNEICPGGPGPKCVRHGCKSAAEMAMYHGPRHAARLPLQRRVIDKHAAPSRALGEYLNRFGLDTQTLPNPRSRKFDLDPSFEAGEEYFAYVGTHAEKKGIQNLVRAAEWVAEERDRSLRVRIAGDGPLREQLATRIEDAGLGDHVTLEGYLSEAELRSLVANARAVVVPSIWMENFPTVISEAFSLGRPVIGSDRGGIPEMLDFGERGIVYPATDIEQLGTAMLELLDDPDRAAALGRAGYEYAASDLDPERHREGLVDLLRSVAGDRT